MDELCYVFTTTNRQINLEKRITQTDHIIPDRGQQTDTRLQTKKIQITITNQIPKAKTNKNNNNRNQIQQPQMKQQQNQAENREQKQQQQKNFTIRKAKTTSSTQYHINKEPPPKTTDNYPEIQKTTPTKKENKRSTSPPQKQAQPELTTIPETQIVSRTQTQEATQISFLSPSMVTKNRYQIPSSTPETIDVTTPANNEPNNKETTSTPHHSSNNTNEPKHSPQDYTV